MEIIEVIVAAVIVIGVDVFLLILLSRDASRHDIYLSRTTRILFLLTPTFPFVVVWYIVKRIQYGAIQDAQAERKRVTSVKGASPALSLSDPSLLVESPEDLLQSLDARTRARFMKDATFKRMLAAYKALPIGGEESSREMKRLVDYIQEQIVTFR